MWGGWCTRMSYVQETANTTPGPAQRAEALRACIIRTVRDVSSTMPSFGLGPVRSPGGAPSESREYGRGSDQGEKPNQTSVSALGLVEGWGLPT